MEVGLAPSTAQPTMRFDDTNHLPGGLNAGSRAYGLGGGFKITPENITIGLGIGINPANASANVQFSGTTTGHFELVLETSGELSCAPGTKDGKSVLTCKSAPKEHKATRG